MTTEPVFRFAAHEDAAAVLALIELAYRGPENAGNWDSESHLLTGPRTSLDEVDALIGDRDSRFVTAWLETRLVGCALIQKRPGFRPTAYFGMFAVDPAMRLRGYGRRVLAEAEKGAREAWRAHAMVMTVINVRRELIAWYQRRGYRLTGARLPFPFAMDSGETTRDFDLVEMRKDF